MTNNKLQLVQQDLEATKIDFNKNVEELGLKLNFKQELDFAMQAFQKNPSLLSCSPETVRNCLINLSLTNLTLNPLMQFAYLVPRGGKCVVDPSYMGLCKVLTDTGSVVSIKAGLVWSDEPFQIERGSGGFVKHGVAEKLDQNRSFVGAYSVAKLHDGSFHVDWMYPYEIEDIKKRSKGGKSWSTDYGEMAKKTVIKRHWKTLPKSERAIMAATAIDIDHENNGIDFKEEQKEQYTNIDVIDPTNQSNLDKYGPIAQMIFDQRVPEDLFQGVGQTRQQFFDSFAAEFNSGTMPVGKADQFLSTLRQYCG